MHECKDNLDPIYCFEPLYTSGSGGSGQFRLMSEIVGLGFCPSSQRRSLDYRESRPQATFSKAVGQSLNCQIGGRPGRGVGMPLNFSH